MVDMKGINTTWGRVTALTTEVGYIIMDGGGIKRAIKALSPDILDPGAQDAAAEEMRQALESLNDALRHLTQADHLLLRRIAELRREAGWPKEGG